MFRLDIKFSVLLGCIVAVTQAAQYCLVNDYNSVTPYFATNTNSSDNTLTLVNCKIETELIENDPVTNICNHVMPNGTVTVPVFVLTIRNDTIGADKSFYSVCRNGGSGILSWIKWSVYQKYFGESEVFEGHSFIGRIKIEVPAVATEPSTNITTNITEDAVSVEPEPSYTYEYCTVDLVSGRCLSVITKRILEMSNDTEMLIEKLPILYELHFIQYNPWRNVTTLRRETVGSSTMSNFKTFIKYEENDVPYSYIEENLIEFPKYFVRNAPVNMYENGVIVNNFIVGRGKYVPVNGTLLAVRKIPSLRSVDVHVRGNVNQEVSTFKSELIIVYDRVRVPANDVGFQFSATIVRTIVSNLVLEYDEFYDVNKFPTQPTPEPEPEPTTEEIEENEDITTESAPTRNNTRHPDFNATSPPNPPNGIYPGYKTVAIIASIIFFSVVLIAATDVSRKIIRSRREKQRRMLSMDQHYSQVSSEKIY